jgi:hypothetical protein
MSVSTIYTGVNGNIRVQGTLGATGVAVNAGLGTAPAQLQLVAGPAAGVSSQFILAAGGSDTSFDVQPNQLVLNSFDTATGLLRDQLLATAPGSGLGVPSITNPSLLSLTGAQQSGVAVSVAAATQTVISLTGLAVGGLVLVQPAAAATAAIAAGSYVSYAAGTATIHHVAAAGGEQWKWFVVKLA